MDSRYGNYIFLFSETSKPVPKFHPASYSTTISFPFPEVKQPGRKADHFLPHSVNFKNAWRHTFAPAHIFISWYLTNPHKPTLNITLSFLLHLQLLNVTSLFLSYIPFFVFLFSIYVVFPKQMWDTARADKTVRGHLLIPLLHPAAAVHLSRQTNDLPDAARPFREIVPLFQV